MSPFPRSRCVRSQRRDHGSLRRQFGRKALLGLSLVAMGLTTTAVGLLLQAGNGRCRAHGGRAATPTRRLYGGFPHRSVPGGFILANIVFLATSMGLGAEHFAGWAGASRSWRASCSAGRAWSSGSEWRSPAFAELRKETAATEGSRVPVFEVLRSQRKDVPPAGGEFAGTDAVGCIFTAYVLSFATTQLPFTRDWILLPALISATALPASSRGRLPCFRPNRPSQGDGPALRRTAVVERGLLRALYDAAALWRSVARPPDRRRALGSPRLWSPPVCQPDTAHGRSRDI